MFRKRCPALLLICGALVIISVFPVHKMLSREGKADNRESASDFLTPAEEETVSAEYTQLPPNMEASEPDSAADSEASGTTGTAPSTTDITADTVPSDTTPVTTKPASAAFGTTSASTKPASAAFGTAASSEPASSQSQLSKKQSFRVVGYYPYWNPDKTYTLQYDILTHVIYAFAIPSSDGTLLPLENPSLATSIIDDAHAAGCKVLLSVGGWSYNNVPLESTFAEATATKEKRSTFVSEIVKMCETYGFDGIDIDWEYPRVNSTDTNYEAFMLSLADELHSRGKLLTAAVVNGMSAEGYTYSSAYAQTDAVLKCVDWINIMAYDGGDGVDSSPYETAVAGASYWQNHRNVPADKIVLGVPFFGITDYDKSVSLLKKKTEYAHKSLGGLMIWEISKDYRDHNSALLNIIAKTIAGLSE